MEPESEERLARRGFGLSDLVLMMREHKIVATGVDVAMLTKVLMREDDAFSMPTGTAPWLLSKG